MLTVNYVGGGFPVDDVNTFLIKFPRDSFQNRSVSLK